MEEFGVFDAGGVERGGGDVERDDRVFADGAGLEMAGPANDERDVGAGIVEPLFAAEEAAAVIAEDEDDGVVEEAVFFEFIEGDAELAVPVVDGIEVVGDFVADDGVIGIVGRELDFGGVY